MESPVGLKRIVANYPEHNLYVGLNPARRSKKLRIGSRDVSRFQAFLVDIDPIAPESDPMTAMKEVLACAHDLLGEEYHPVIVDSGRGIQLWFRSFDPIAVTEETVRGWELAIGAFLRQLARGLDERGGCRVDTSCSDLARLARLPGSTNQKSGRLVTILEPGERSRGLGDRLGRFECRLDTAQAPHVSGVRTWQRVFHSLTVTARRFITEGVDEPGRHGACYAAAASMKELGVSIESAAQAVRLGSSLCRPMLSEADAFRAMRNAYTGRGSGDQDWRTRVLESV